MSAMTIASALGLAPSRKVRYGFVALGDIAQEAMLPGVAHTGNSEVTAFVTGDAEKAKALGKRYDVSDVYGYEEFDALLSSGKVDALYLATPNWRHAEFILPALRAGIHVLVEKPLEVSAEKCREIMAAQAASKAKLMVAYRLHFEPNTLAVIDRIRAGELGEVFLFSAAFSQRSDPANSRSHNGVLAGPLLDMAPYPINAARYLFGAEPTEVIAATSVRHADNGLEDMDDTVAVTLRFPGDRLAQFVVSYYGNRVDSYYVVGTKGSIQLKPGFGYGKKLEQQVTIGDKASTDSEQPTDQFGGEMRYFSDCILNDREPEPDAEEGLADLRVVEGVMRAIASGRAEQLEPFERSRRIDTEAQKQTLPPISPPEPVNAASPAGG
jgi:predicted dehydrogenase